VDETFLEAFYVVPPKVLGKQLLPFSCGRAMNLEVLESPFMRGGLITPPDLIVGVWVCSQKYKDCKAKMQKSVLSEEAEKELEQEAFEWGQAEKVWRFEETREIFETYISAFTKAPSRWKKQTHRKPKAPWPLVVATTLIRDLRIPIDEAWEMPLPEALWYFAAVAELDGDDSLVTPEERERLRIAKENAAKLQEELNV